MRLLRVGGGHATPRVRDASWRRSGCVAAGRACATAGNACLQHGVLTDMSGLFATLAGDGSVVAAYMAVEDFGGEVLGKKIRVFLATTNTTPMLLRHRSALVQRGPCWRSR